MEPIEYKGLPASEKDLALDAIRAAFSSTRLTTQQFIDSGIDETALRAQMLPGCRAKWDSDRLAQPAVQYGERYLTVACRYVVQVARTLPGFESEINWRIYLASQRYYEVLEQALNSVVLPTYRKGGSYEIADFEAKFRQDVVSSFRDIYQFGLTEIPPEMRRQPVDIAYVSLDVSRSLRATTPTATHRQSIEQTLGRLIRRDSTHADRGDKGKAIRALLVGEAGSGKTTVLQWFATGASTADLPV